jgi:hypothetical protein
MMIQYEPADPIIVTLLSEIRAMHRRLAQIEARLDEPPSLGAVAMDEDDEVAVIEARLLRRAQQKGMVISGDGRVSEKDAAVLIAKKHKALANARRADRGPEPTRRGVGGSRISYSLRSLAIWVAAGRIL